MTYDVVIAGAGPVGLFLACELGRAGISVLVLERAEAPTSPLKGPAFGLRGLSAPSIEAFYRQGLLEELRKLSATSPLIQAVYRQGQSIEELQGAHWMQQARRPAGHFAGLQFFHEAIDESKWAWRLPSPAGTRQAVYMGSLETFLAARAEASGVEIRRGHGVDGLAVSDEGVAVQACGETFRSLWLVGCDGGRSAVRRIAGFEFTGTEPEFTGYSVEAELADPEPFQPGLHAGPEGFYSYVRPGTIAMADFDRGAFHRTQPITLEHVQAVLRRVSGVDVTLTALKLATTWTDRAYQATTYRQGRVLLAGDAAHIHSPLGGQGLNLGLGDAVNMGWKLASTLRGEVPEDLLDTYTRERHPVGAAVLDWSRAQVEIMRPHPSARALRAVLRDLITTGDGATYFAERVWAVSLRYDLGDAHPLVGRSVPDFELADGQRLGELFAVGKGLLLDFDSLAPLAGLAGRWDGRIAYVASDAKDRLGLTALLVRPDGIVAWVSEGEPCHDAATLAASRWFGEPESTCKRPATIV